jgi:subtilisin family serine protease
VVAILDTGVGEHTWLPEDDVVERDVVDVLGDRIGLTDPAEDPEAHPDLVGPLDGTMDPVAGHGTFIAGVVLQAAPDVRILAIRVADPLGVVEEGKLVEALGQLGGLLDTWRESGGKLGRPIDVVNLSLSYYHETPKDLQFDTLLYGALVDLRKNGCVVVTSAGNDATERPTFPASLWPWPGADNGIPTDAFAPHVSVGALNPGSHTTALFSNTGPWVRTFAVGASVVSTSPAFETGLRATSHKVHEGRLREGGDPDDFRGGFAVWSGTSFAAPRVAGLIAAQLGDELLGDTASAPPIPDALETAVKRARDRTGSVLAGLDAADLSGPAMP